ncbi:hypothetical protein NEMBOFW57_003645 [Staphylotrichum longicolle]|uniref:Uncharacterized protein n=1 Tax=Staphylotrichum longicolle TaxID=669026 RepID=A0AAD4F5N5_9PEZI|nr:hypothetical protein NEMBOFW57_003645 [Staphylotrichum longicolle]
MTRLTSALRASVIYGLLAASSGEAVSPRATPPVYHQARHVDSSVSDANPATITAVSNCHPHGATQYCQAGTTEFRVSGTVTASSYSAYCMAGSDEVQIIAVQAAQAAQATQTITPTPTSAAASSTAASSVTAVFCMAGTAEYEVHTSVTATQDIPPAFTGCHSHAAETFCMAPNGDEVEIHAAGEEEETAESSSAGQNCHFHAGVEHCVSAGASESGEKNCARVNRDYNIKLRVGLLFVMLATSAIGVFTPILIASYVSPKHPVFTILRQFGTGVIISTAFVHLYTHATLMFANECLGELSYESTSSAILMAGLFLSFLIEYAGNRLIQWHEAKAQPASVESAGHSHGAASPAARTDMVNITVLEAGVIFHSLLIGLTLVVAGDSFFLTLFAVIVFHQMFEGLALGTRIAALGRPCPTSSTDTTASGIPGHNHAHGHEHYHNHDADPPPGTTTEPKLAAAPDSSADSTHSTAAGTLTPSVSMRKKLLLALAFAVVTPLGMGIGIGVLHNFNGNDPATIIAIGTLDALSAGILVWVGVVEMWAHDWMLGGEMTRAGPVRTGLGLVALVVGMAVMSLLGKWA